MSNPARVDIGGGFSVAAPLGHGWQTTGAPGSYHKPLEPEGRGLLLTAVTGPSGINREEILSLRGADAGKASGVKVAAIREKTWP